MKISLFSKPQILKLSVSKILAWVVFYTAPEHE